jgi:hypothetical protein
MNMMVFKMHSQNNRDLQKYFFSVYIIIAVLILLTSVAGATGPSIIEITPSVSADTGRVSVSLYGTDFAEGANIVLVPVNSQPIHKGSIMNGTGGALLNRPDSVYISGNYAYVASTASRTLEIINISDPANPEHTGSIEAGSLPSGIAVSGHYAYIINNGGDSLKIIDISNPAKPVERYRTGDSGDDIFIGGASGITVSGNYAYIAGGTEESLVIVNISNATKPVRESRIMNGNGGALLKSPMGIYKSGNYVYVASYGSDALEIVDVTDPAKPVHKGNLVDGDGGCILKRPRSVFVSGNYAYVTSYAGNALEIVDVTDPAKPLHKGKIVVGEGGAILNQPRSVFVSGNTAYIASMGSNALEIIDVSNPAKPVHKSSMENDSPVGKRTGASLGQPYSVFISGDYAYIGSDSSDALEIVDIGTITGTDVTVISPTQIACTFNVTNKTPGPYRVFITNPDGSYGVAPVQFRVGMPSVPGPTPTHDLDPGFAIPCIGLLLSVLIGRIRKISGERRDVAAELPRK